MSPLLSGNQPEPSLHMHSSNVTQPGFRDLRAGTEVLGPDLVVAAPGTGFFLLIDVRKIATFNEITQRRG
ncbi:MAG TPA: hypothetical protein VGQ12_12610 [Candidatus Angelobacter sp.]|nr:hypothetical protein [Candidatus Angelobacter sp.]